MIAQLSAIASASRAMTRASKETSRSYESLRKADLFPHWHYRCYNRRLCRFRGRSVMREANKLTRRLLDASSRPIVVARGSDPDKCVCTFLENAGRDSAFASVRKRAIFSTTRLFSGPPLPTTKEHM